MLKNGKAMKPRIEKQYNTYIDEGMILADQVINSKYSWHECDFKGTLLDWILSKTQIQLSSAPSTRAVCWWMWMEIIYWELISNLYYWITKTVPRSPTHLLLLPNPVCLCRRDTGKRKAVWFKQMVYNMTQQHRNRGRLPSRVESTWSRRNAPSTSQPFWIVVTFIESPFTLGAVAYLHLTSRVSASARKLFTATAIWNLSFKVWGTNYKPETWSLLLRLKYFFCKMWIEKI